MGVAKEPDLYRCAIGYVGVYDMAAMYHQGDIADSKSGKNFLVEALGKQNLDEISPTAWLTGSRFRSCWPRVGKMFVPGDTHRKDA
jgi:hypothetical protein